MESYGDRMKFASQSFGNFGRGYWVGWLKKDTGMVEEWGMKEQGIEGKSE